MMGLARSSVYQAFNNRCAAVVYAISTWRNRLIAWLTAVKLGKQIRFFGKAHFLKAKDAQLIIGDYCSFRSTPVSNWIGINRPCMLSAHAGAKLIIGKNCGFSGTVIGCFSQITLGNKVRCGANTLITDSDWHLDDPRSSDPKPIHIHDNVWLGVNVTVMKGVTIGKNSVIGAGSVVTKSIPANVIAAGNPCRAVKKLMNDAH